ncbi:hypothetical protein AAFX24_17350 [Vibrio mediterranei]|uniref:hypothetical protein n=1 Tax=Vibrio mediterranei TaxID=689 RepID=UPI0038CED57D
MANSYLLVNPFESIAEPFIEIKNVTRETQHPIEPAMYIQLQAEALFGVRLGTRRLTELLVQFYGYQVFKTYDPEQVEYIDIIEAREMVDANALYHDETLGREGLMAAIRQSIPGDVVTLSEQQAEGI